MRATRVRPARAFVVIAATVSALIAGAAAAQPPATAVQQFAPVTVKGERVRTEGPFSPFVYEALGATPRITLPALRHAAARPENENAAAASPFVYQQLGATPRIRLPMREPTVTDTAQ